MKKKFLTLFLCIYIALSCFVFVGCNNNKTKEDVETLFTSMKEDTKTKDLFDGNRIKISLQGVNLTSSDKGYIFPAVYDVYLEASGCLFFNIVDRFDKSSLTQPVARAVKDFTTTQINDIYKKLNTVYDKLKNLADSKSIYETMEANLHYKDLIKDYCALIDAMYDLNFTYADYYFSGSGFVDYSLEETELADSNVKTMLSFVLLNVSKVSYDYEVLNYTVSNPLGEVKDSWIDKTTYVNPFLTLCNTTLTNIKSSNDIAQTISTQGYTNKVKTLLKNIQKEYDEYSNGYNLFTKALDCFDAKNYFLSNNKSAYIENCSNKEQSCYRVIQNFLTGRYQALFNALSGVNSYI